MHPFSAVFLSYEKIAERPADWRLDEKEYRFLSKAPWVVTEKIHGANFVILTDGSEVAFAKRKALLAPDEEFFGYQILSSRLKESAAALFGTLRREHSDLTTLTIYGELFGGAYPHPSVPADSRVEAIQTGIWYSPTIEYCVFDLAVVCGDEPRRYLDFDVAMSKAAAAGFFASEPLLTGACEKALAYPLGFESTIPARLGLPPLPESNKAEGVVIKPLRAGDAFGCGAGRPVLKRKTPEFAEDSRFQEARKWTKVVGPAWAEEQSALSLLQEEIGGWLCLPRLHNALSKIGRVRPGDTARSHELAETLAQDILEEIGRRHPDLWALLSTPAREQFEREIRHQAQALANSAL
jgi:Rnl2 family RNA ligase